MIVIENLEEPSEWLFIEYEHAFQLLGKDLLITNVKHPELKEFLRSLGIAFEERSVVEILGRLPRPWVVLDPKGKKALEPEEARGTVIVGGILGSHPPKGRTWRELTSRLPRDVLVRNIGEGQFTIDGACAVAYLISRGKRLEEIEIMKGLRVKMPSMPGMEGYEEIPYWYPVIDGKPFVSQKLIEYLKRTWLL
ncbi:hypothetical protein IPA_01480 [Ignicoccus pacificus DSM 13166]|uniref:Uncharacterized protein n=1 Tax=Ignicoccus pacificus DSM 13166 TaxID=940294 RepID=A0A977K904_9CREN|nr:hypothetical protein IPA_01480 [Ignicoccus pacificus DSM 13166]